MGGRVDLTEGQNGLKLLDVRGNEELGEGKTE